jgi:membrane protein YdbS with pleckstrin-like domain
MSQHVDAAAAWIYRGVWAAIVALFRVPPHPPTLPAAGESVRSLRPAPGYLRYLQFFFWVLLIPGDVIPIAAWVAIAIPFPALGVVLAVPFLVLMVAPDVIAYIAIHLRYDTTWYVLTDRSMRIRRGIWIIHETTISFVNVQNVEVLQGPVQRFFGIADVIVLTAGGGGGQQKGEASASSGAHVGMLQGLDDAGAVRDLILDRVKRTRSTGLGDERFAPPAAAGTIVPVLSPMHLAVLREISEAARRMTTVQSKAPR